MALLLPERRRLGRPRGTMRFIIQQTVPTESVEPGPASHGNVTVPPPEIQHLAAGKNGHYAATGARIPARSPSFVRVLGLNAIRGVGGGESHPGGKGLKVAELAATWNQRKRKRREITAKREGHNAIRGVGGLTESHRLKFRVWPLGV